MSKNNNISTLNEALPMLRELENECGEDMPIYNVVTELLPYLDNDYGFELNSYSSISLWKQSYSGWLSG